MFLLTNPLPGDILLAEYCSLQNLAVAFCRGKNRKEIFYYCKDGSGRPNSSSPVFAAGRLVINALIRVPRTAPLQSHRWLLLSPFILLLYWSFCNYPSINTRILFAILATSIVLSFPVRDSACGLTAKVKRIPLTRPTSNIMTSDMTPHFTSLGPIM